MPNKDGTGPHGKGPMTGQGLGFCIMQIGGREQSDLKGFMGLQGRPVYETTWGCPPSHKATEDASRKEAVMPAGDGTGPMGMGAMTGRAAGFCAGFEMPGYMNPVSGRGWGMGRGRGFGRGLGMGFRGGRGRGGYGVLPFAPPVYPYAAPTREQELDALKGQAEYFEGTLGDLRKRIEELEAEKAVK